VSSLGAAYLAGLATGVWSGPHDLPMLTAVGCSYDPDPAVADRVSALRERGAEAVRRSLRWEQGS
jgi:glycerol kinase